MQVSVNKGRIWNLVVFNHYFTTINTNNITISCQTYSLMLLYKKITFNCSFSMRIYQFSLFVKSDTTFGYSLERPVEGVQNPEEAGPPALDTSEVSFRTHPDAATYENVECLPKSREFNWTAKSTLLKVHSHPGAILYSVPPQPTQEVPHDISENSCLPDTQEESQSILQFI